jgi:hypothetical protein
MRINEIERKSVPRVVCLQYLLQICIASALLNALVFMSAGGCTLLLAKIGWACTNYSSRRVVRKVTCPVGSVKSFSSYSLFFGATASSWPVAHS